jgi:hypothetical protein
MLQNQLQFDANQVTVVQVIVPCLLPRRYRRLNMTSIALQVVANLGAILGGSVVGYGSEFLGRRLSIIMSR